MCLKISFCFANTDVMQMKYLFIDRDGTLIKEPADEQVDSVDKLEFMPGVFTALKSSIMTSYQTHVSKMFPEGILWALGNDSH